MTKPDASDDVTNTGKPCPVCGGIGKAMERTHAGFRYASTDFCWYPQEKQDVIVRCSNCQGEGVLHPAITGNAREGSTAGRFPVVCNACNGTGWVAEQERSE